VLCRPLAAATNAHGFFNTSCVSELPTKAGYSADSDAGSAKSSMRPREKGPRMRNVPSK
jgi:hypothetical protein